MATGGNGGAGGDGSSGGDGGDGGGAKTAGTGKVTAGNGGAGANASSTNGSTGGRGGNGGDATISNISSTSDATGGLGGQGGTGSSGGNGGNGGNSTNNGSGTARAGGGGGGGYGSGQASDGGNGGQGGNATTRGLGNAVGGQGGTGGNNTAADSFGGNGGHGGNARAEGLSGTAVQSATGGNGGSGGTGNTAGGYGGYGGDATTYGGQQAFGGAGGAGGLPNNNVYFGGSGGTATAYGTGWTTPGSNADSSIQGPTNVRQLFERLWATTNQNGGAAPSNYSSTTSMSDDGMHIDRVTNYGGVAGQVGYVVYFGGTGFSTKLSGDRNTEFANNISYVDPQWDEEIQTFVRSTSAPIMLVGFSQGGMDAQNIGAALKRDGYNVKEVVTLASPITQTPSNTAYTAVNFTPTGDVVGDGVVYAGGVLLAAPLLADVLAQVPALSPWVPFAEQVNTNAGTASDAGQVYKAYVGAEPMTCGGFPQHGCLATYLTLADSFDIATHSSLSGTQNQFRYDLQAFAGQIVVNRNTSFDDGYGDTVVVPVYYVSPN